MANVAAQRREISRGASPMIYTEERLDESKDEARERHERLESERNKKSTFLIGTIENVNEKISNLDRKLQSYTALVIESRASDRSETESYYTSSSPSDRSKETSHHDKALAEAKEVNQFAGIYSMKSTFFGKQSERVKNISKISMNPSKASLHVLKLSKRDMDPPKDSGKPKFVELHQYPGYDESELTPLPNGTSAIEILAKVANAQTTLKTKKSYLPEFERIFFSPMCQAILQDMFWWLFLEKWQASKSSQPKLFNRIAHNYVGILVTANHPTYRDTFLTDFPSLLSQAIYAAYCDAFPDSYRQFNDDFKWDLVNLVFSWIAGLSPAPRLWHHWNMGALEPANIKQREELMMQAKKDKEKKVSGLGDQDFPTSQPPPASLLSASQSTLHQAPSLSSLGSKRHSINRKPGAKLKGKGSNSAVDSSTTGVGETPRRRGTLNGKQGIPPILEGDEDEKARARAEHLEAYLARIKKKDRSKESHPACKGPDFVRNVFNIQGQSPLVKHFLTTQHLSADAGQAVYIQRTQMENLPPLDTPTYRDIRHKSYRKVREIGKGHQQLVDQGVKESNKYAQKQRAMLLESKKKERTLLSQQREVKRLSDLIMLELRKDDDSITAGAGHALELALQAQDN